MLRPERKAGFGSNAETPYSAAPAVPRRNRRKRLVLPYDRRKAYGSIHSRYDRALKEIRPTEAVIVEKGTFDDLLEKQPVYFFGNGAEKCETVIAHPNAHFVKGIIPEARNMLPLAQQSIVKGEFEDVAYFEPYYLKEFIATTPKKLL